MSAPFDVGAVMRQVHFAFRKADKAYEGAHSTYSVQVDGGSIRLRAVAGSGSRTSAPLYLTTRSVQRGDERLERGARATETRSDGTLAMQKGSITEHLANTSEGVEQSWELSSPPAGKGDLVVRVTARGQRFRGASNTGLHFVDDRSGLGFRYGHGTFVDAKGVRTHVESRWVDGAIALTVPDALLNTASYPVVLDPTAQPEFEMNEPILEPATAAQTRPEISWGSGMFLVVWEDNRAGNLDIYAARVQSNGTVLDPSGIAVATAAGDQSRPDVAAAGSTWYVVWQDDRNLATTNTDIYGARVTTAGALVDATGIAISTAAAAQTDPAISTLNGANLFVAWGDRRPGANGSDIYGSRWSNATVLDPAGIAVSIAVNDQRDPDVATSAGGNYFVVWEDARNGTDDDIFGARVSTAGVNLDATGIGISSVTGFQDNPAVVTDGTNYYIVWEDGRTDPGGVDVYGGRVSTAGAPLDGSGIAISTATGHQKNAAISRSGTNFMVVWDDARNVGSFVDIYAARITPVMAVLEPSGIAVTNAGSSQERPSAAYDGSSVFIAWEDFRDTKVGRDVWGARLTSTGTLLDAGGLLLSPDAGDQSTPDVAFDGTNYLVAWEDYRNGSATSGDVVGVRVSGTGTVLDASGIVIASATGRQYAPQIAFDGTNYLVTWSDRRIANDENIHATRVSTAGSVLDGAAGFAVCTAATNQSIPAVAFDGTNYLIVWADNRTPANAIDIYGTRVSPAASVLDGTGFGIAALSGAQSEPDVAFDGTNWLVVWSDDRNSATTSYDIYGARVSPSATILDPAGIAITNAASFQFSPAVSRGAGGVSLVSWSDFRNSGVSGSDIYATRVDSSASVLDPSGVVVTNELNTQEASTVAFDGTDWLVVWQDNRPGSASTDIYANRIAVSGSVLDGTGFVISNNSVGETFPSTASDGAGHWLVVYQRPDPAPSSIVRVAGRFVDNVQANGAACSGNGECQSGFCIDSVCCATSCGTGTSSDCFACSVAAGASVDGVCSMTTLPTGCNVAPGLVTLVSPSGTITTSTPTYVWQPLQTATAYRLWVNDSVATRVNQVYTPSQLGCSDGVTACSVAPSSTLSPGVGKFWVQAQNGGGTGSWGSGLAFTVDVQAPPTTAPTPIAPTGTVATTTPAYTWTRISVATDYFLWVNDSKGLRIQQVVSAASAGCATSGDCSVTPSTGLYEGAATFWVRAQNSSGNGPWSVAQPFVVDLPTLPGLVTLSSPIGAGTNNPTYTWQSEPASTQYNLWVNDSVANRVNIILNSSTVCAGSTCSYFPNATLSSGNAHWWVQGKNSSGNGPWGSGAVFSVP